MLKFLLGLAVVVNVIAVYLGIVHYYGPISAFCIVLNGTLAYFNYRTLRRLRDEESRA